MISLNGRRALVCGSTQGIGRAAAVVLARQGAEVVLLARNQAELEKVRSTLPHPGGARHEWLVADFSDPDRVRAVATEYLAAAPPVHILVNNTGGPPPGRAIDSDAEAFRAAFAMHLLSNHALVQACAPGMRAARYGRIINVVSTSVREPIRGLGVSNTIRGAVASWAKTLSKELGPDGITVNNLLPGYTRTGRLDQLLDGRARTSGEPREAIDRALLADIPVGRFAEAEEIGFAIAFLASPAAAYITGVSLPVDGGRLASI